MALSPYQICIVIPPALAFVYSIATQCFLSGWHECPWTFHAASITLRFTILVAAVGIIFATATHEHSNEKSSVLLPAIFLPTISMLLLYRTRKIYITGPKPSLEKTALGKVAMVTGANTGIGKETARQLLQAGATVIMACRSESRAREAMEDILRILPNHSYSGKDNNDGDNDTTQLLPPRERLLFLKCDVSDYDSVRKSVQDLNSMNLPLDILINNAGIMMGTRKQNKSGHELTMACNHLGHFLLTNLLLPKLQQSDDGRVLVVTSSTYVLANAGIDLEDLNCEERKYTMFSQYAQSKLANIMMAKELVRREARRCEGTTAITPVAVHIVHPGLVRTDVVRNMPWYLKYPNMIFSLVLVTLQKAPEAGAYTNVFCAISKSLEGQSGGDYFSNSQIWPVNTFANDEKKAEALWDLSVALTSKGGSGKGT